MTPDPRDHELPGFDARLKIDDIVQKLAFARARVEPVDIPLLARLDDIDALAETIADAVADRDPAATDRRTGASHSECSCGSYAPCFYPPDSKERE